MRGKVYRLFRDCAGYRREYAIRRNPHRRHTNVAVPWYRRLAYWVVLQAVVAVTAACSAAAPIPGPTSVPAAAPTEQPTAQAQVSPTATQQPPTAEATPTSDPSTWVRFYPPDGNPLLVVPCSNSRDNFASPREVTVKAGAEVPFSALRAIAHKCQDDMSLLRILYSAGGGLVRTMVADDGNTYYSAQPPGCTPSKCTPVLDIPSTDITFLLYANTEEVTDEVSAVQRGDLMIKDPPSPVLPLHILSPVRPVDPSVPLYHAYGVPVGGDPAGDGHNGYDYGFQACTEINYPVLTIDDGIVMQMGGEGDVWIDHGIVRLSDGTVWRVVSSYWHIHYSDRLTMGMHVARGDPIARFLTCAESGYFPELELQMIRADPTTTRGLKEHGLLAYLRASNYHNGEFTHFDPALIGLPAYKRDRGPLTPAAPDWVNRGLNSTLVP